jgi:hypothetical protein
MSGVMRGYDTILGGELWGLGRSPKSDFQSVFIEIKFLRAIEHLKLSGMSSGLRIHSP